MSVTMAAFPQELPIEAEERGPQRPAKTTASELHEPGPLGTED